MQSQRLAILTLLFKAIKIEIAFRVILGSGVTWEIRELKQTQRRRQRERHLKMELRVSEIIS